MAGAAAAAAKSGSTAARAVRAATKTVASNPTGLVTVAATVSTLGLTLVTALRDSMGDRKGLDYWGTLLGPTASVFAGVSLLVASQGGRFGGGNTANFIRGGAIGLMGMGLVAGLSGATGRLNPHRDTRLASELERGQKLRRFTPGPIASVAQLEGVRIGVATARTTDGAATRIDMYLDPLTAQQLPAGTAAIDAIRHAQAAAQSDEQDRSFAVVQTSDGGLWSVRLAGELDQIDGRHYGSGNSLDPAWIDYLRVEGRHPAVLGVAGVEHFRPMSVAAPNAARDEGMPVVPVLKPNRTTGPSTAASGTRTESHASQSSRETKAPAQSTASREETEPDVDTPDTTVGRSGSTTVSRGSRRGS